MNTLIICESKDKDIYDIKNDVEEIIRYSKYGRYIKSEYDNNYDQITYWCDNKSFLQDVLELFQEIKNSFPTNVMISE